MRKKIIICLFVAVLIAVTLAGCQPGAEKRPEPEAGNGPLAEGKGKRDESEGEKEMDERQAEVEKVLVKEIKLQYLGHSCFLLEADNLRILMDPFSPQVGYGTLNLEADVVTLSHEHVDHNYADAAPGAKILRGLTPDGLGWEEVSFSSGDISISSLPTYHDDASGKLRGRNAVFIFDVGDLRVAHLGDLGHVLSQADVEKLAAVDILLLPVGGHYTIDAREAKQVAAQLNPPVVIPMHYQTKVTRNWPIQELKVFLEGEENVQQKGDKPVIVASDKLPAVTEIWVLEPARP